MIKRILFFVLSMFFISCSKSENEYIVYNLVTQPLTVNPYNYSDQLSVQVMNNIYEGLLRLDEKNKYELALASSMVKENNKYIFEINKDAKWSDGSKITNSQIIEGFRTALNKSTAARYADLLYPIKNAKKYNKGEIDASQLGVYEENGKVVIELEKDIANFEYVLTLPISFPYNNGLYSGPYIITKSDSTKILLEKNEQYWNKKIDPKKIKIIFVSDFSVVENLIENGQLDITRVENFNLKKKKENNELFHYENGRVWYIDFNFENELLKDKNNRIAIRDAINRDDYVNIIKNDGSNIAKSVLSDVFTDFRSKYGDKNNFEDNKKSDILSGKTLRLLAGNSSTEVKEANYLQEILRKNLNLNVEVKIVSFKDRLALTRSGDYDMVLNTYSPKTSDELTILKKWYNKKKNYYHIWSKDKYEKLYEKIYETVDIKPRLELINEAQNILIDEAVIAPIYFSTENWYVSKKLSNIVVHPISNTMDLFRIK